MEKDERWKAAHPDRKFNSGQDRSGQHHKTRKTKTFPREIVTPVLLIINT
jgi:hypothetical protein